MAIPQISEQEMFTKDEWQLIADAVEVLIPDSEEGCALRNQVLARALRQVEIAPEKLDIERIQRRVSEFFHIELADLTSKKRTQRIAFCRQVAMYLCRKMTDSSFPAIGEHFGRDHSTVIHAFNLIDRRIAHDSAFRFSIEKIERELKRVALLRIESLSSLSLRSA